MIQDLFPTNDHDPGGKVRHKMPSGMRGDAHFAGLNGERRPRLRRWIGGDDFPDHDFALWIGMNPSTADAMMNDPTIGREWSFTAAWGYSGYWKVNVSDYRATNPKELLGAGLRLESDGNRAGILYAAAKAQVVICCWGAVNRALEPMASSVLVDLRAAGVPLHCLGLTSAGHPRHPLYVAGNTPLQPF